MSSRMSPALALLLIVSGLAKAQWVDPTEKIDPLCPVSRNASGLQLNIIKQGYELECGETNPRSPFQEATPSNRIFYGLEALPGEFPYQARLIHKGNHSCGGVIIDNYHILTAAHCLDDFDNGAEPYNCKKDLRVVVGGHSDLDMGGQVCLEVDKYFIHEKYDITWFGYHDIALIRTKTPIKYRFTQQGYGSINRVCMPKSYVHEYFGSAVVSGWGKTEFPELPRILQWLEVPIVKNSECTKDHKHIKDEQIICTRGIRDNSTGILSGAGGGDSGGPLVQIVDGRRHLIGIVNGGNQNPFSGQLLGPDVFAKVSYHLDWIKGHIDSE